MRFVTPRLHVLLLTLLACSEPPAPTGAEAPGAEHSNVPAFVREIRMRTGERMEQADLWKPSMEQEVALDLYQAPLLHLAPQGPVPSALSFDGDGNPTLDPSDPVLYFAEEDLGAGRTQRTFLWFRTDPSQAQGVRIVTHADNQPALIELLHHSTGSRVLHLSERLGDLEFDESAPVPHVQAGTFALGFQPTGPYLYQSADSEDIWHAHCRCSPAQVDNLVATREYRLLPLITLQDTLRGEPFEPLGEDLLERIE